MKKIPKPPKLEIKISNPKNISQIPVICENMVLTLPDGETRLLQTMKWNKEKGLVLKPHNLKMQINNQKDLLRISITCQSMTLHLPGGEIRPLQTMVWDKIKGLTLSFSPNGRKTRKTIALTLTIANLKE